MTTSPQPPRRRILGRLPGGAEVGAWLLGSPGTLEVEILEWGAIVSRLWVAGQGGQRDDVVLGFSGLEPYLDNPSYFGAVVGRIAGRLPGAVLWVDGVSYPVAENRPHLHLHGGRHGFSRQLWQAEGGVNGSGEPWLRLWRHSPDGEEGYPGAIEVDLVYTLAGDSVLRLESHARSGRPTPLCMTQHSYFNLAGESSGSLAGHVLQIDADHVLAWGEGMAMLPERVPVEGTPCDFRRPRPLEEAIPALRFQHGDVYCLPRKPGPAALARAARLSCPAAGRSLEVWTTESHLQFYTAAHFDGTETGKSGMPYPRHAGCCLECQGFARGSEFPHFDDIMVKPGKSQHRVTEYRFGTP